MAAVVALPPVSGPATAARTLQPRRWQPPASSRHVQAEAAGEAAPPGSALAGAAGASVLAVSAGAAALRWRRRRAKGPLRLRKNAAIAGSRDCGRRRGATAIARAAKGRRPQEDTMGDDDWGDFNPLGAADVYGGGPGPEGDDEEYDDEEEWLDGEEGEEEQMMSRGAKWQNNKWQEDEDEYWPEDGAEYGDDSADAMDAMDGEFDFGGSAEDFVASSTSGVFDGMDDEDFMEDDEYGSSSSSSASPGAGAQELSLLYDDFEVIGGGKKEKKDKDQYEHRSQQLDGEQEDALDTRSKQGITGRERRKLNSLEERVYVVEAEGIAIRTLPDERSPRTGEILRQGEQFTAIEAVDGEGKDERLYLRLPEGRGWVFDDERIYPGFPSVKLVSIAGQQIVEDMPKAPPRPLIAIVGRPNVGKSSLVNRVCDVPDIHGAITFDEEGVTRDRTYKPAEHTDDNGDTYMFEVIDTGGLIFHDDPYSITFRHEIKMQIDVALREAVACIMVVDSQTGLTDDDYQIAKYLKKNYVSRGMKVQLVVAKCDRLETMDQHTAEFWSLDLGEPLPICSLHGRGVWEAVDNLIDRGCNGLFPMKIRGEEYAPSPRDTATSVAIVGKPNAGKSSLLNALVGEARSIVSDIPGTTTDAIDAYLETDQGKVYRFVDTAGVRRRGRIQHGTEWLTVNRALKAVQRSDVALFLLDASEIRTGDMKLGFAYWCPDNQERYLAGAIEERGTACVIVLTKWDAVANKDEKTQKRFIQAVRSNLGGIGQWAEIITCSSKTGQRLKQILEAVEKTLQAHQKRIPTPILNEVVRDALLWKLPAAKSFSKKQGRIYYATQVSTMPPTIALFCNHPKLFGPNYKTYIENKIRQDLNWFGTPLQLEWRKRSERRAVSQAEQWLTPRLQPDTVWR